jgi:NADPH:quinone reductase-like Zn-dependent oxidoreductase
MMMKAVQCATFGGPEVLVLREVEKPTPGPGEVLIKVESAAVNFSDVMRRRKSLYPFPTALPYRPGSEVAGTIEALGAGVKGPAVGTPVFAVVGRDGSGGYAQFALASAQQAFPIPPGLSPDVACGLVVAGATAVLTLREAARLQPGESVLVQGAAGGVGSLAVQLAKVLGAGRVLGAASTSAKRKQVERLGADATIDSSRPDWAAQVRELTQGRGVDVLLEMGGGASFEQGLSALAPFGRSVVYGAADPAQRSLSQAGLDALLSDPALNQSVVAFNLGLYFGLKPQAAGSAVETLIGAILSGKVSVQLGEVFPLAKAAAAHQLLESRRSTGKLVLKPWA